MIVKGVGEKSCRELKGIELATSTKKAKENGEREALRTTQYHS